MKELVLGGARSGKSAWAERRARESGLEAVFIATATAGDEEMAARIARHRASRPAGWRLVEEPVLLAEALRTHAADQRCLIVDCLTLWLSNVLLPADAGGSQAVRNEPAVEAADGPDLMAGRNPQTGHPWPAALASVQSATSEASRDTGSARGPRLGPIGESADGASLHRGPRLGPIGDALFERERAALLDAVSELPGHIILIGNEIGLGVVPLGAGTRRFRDEAGRLHQDLARLCDRVTLLVAGLPLAIKTG